MIELWVPSKSSILTGSHPFRCHIQVLDDFVGCSFNGSLIFRAFVVLLWSARFMLMLSAALVFHLREEKPHLSCILSLGQGLGYNGSGHLPLSGDTLQSFCS